MGKTEYRSPRSLHCIFIANYKITEKGLSDTEQSFLRRLDLCAELYVQVITTSQASKPSAKGGRDVNA